MKLFLLVSAGIRLDQTTAQRREKLSFGTLRKGKTLGKTRDFWSGASALGCSDNGTSMDFVGFTFIVDDIVLPDGRTLMGAVGGGGPQTLFGFQLYANGTSKVGLAAGVGNDFPPQCRHWLEQLPADCSGLQVHTHAPTPRAWQVLEHDGRRTQVWRTHPSEQLYAMLRPDFSQLPASFQTARAYCLGVNPSRPPLKLMRSLKEAAEARAGLMAAETYAPALEPLPEHALRELVSSCHVFSPNEREAASMTGLSHPSHIIQRLTDAGAQLVALRQGPKGVMLADSHVGDVWKVAAVTGVPVVDPTGCGNAFMGAFMAALADGKPLVEAGLWGVVAASFMVEAEGVPRVPPALLRQQALQRLEAARRGVEVTQGLAHP